jgi:hypothetical protein
MYSTTNTGEHRRVEFEAWWRDGYKYILWNQAGFESQLSHLYAEQLGQVGCASILPGDKTNLYLTGLLRIKCAKNL